MSAEIMQFLKVCSACLVNKDVQEYSRQTRASDGFQSRCKQCAKVSHAAYQGLHIKEHRERERRYYSINNDGHRRASAKYYVAHKREISVKKAALRNINPDKYRILSAAYRRTHPFIIRDQTHRRRARIHGVFVESVKMSVLVERDHGQCGICHNEVDKADWSIDHILPISKGGEHSYQNTQLAHLRCNLSKGARIIETAPCLSAVCPESLNEGQAWQAQIIQ